MEGSTAQPSTASRLLRQRTRISDEKIPRHLVKPCCGGSQSQRPIIVRHLPKGCHGGSSWTLKALLTNNRVVQDTEPSADKGVHGRRAWASRPNGSYRCDHGPAGKEYPSLLLEQCWRVGMTGNVCSSAIGGRRNDSGAESGAGGDLALTQPLRFNILPHMFFFPAEEISSTMSTNC